MGFVITVTFVATVVFIAMAIRLVVAWLIYNQLVEKGYGYEAAAKATKHIKFVIQKK